MASAPLSAGIDIGGTRIKAVVVDGAGAVLRERIEPSCDDAPRLLEIAKRILDETAVGATAVGIGAPGLAARDNRSIAWMRGRMQAVEGLDWRERLARNAWVLNDAHAATLAEAWIGAARGAKHAVMLTLGTGVGGGVIVDGRVLQGATGRAGHLGHITLDAAGAPDIVGTPGSLEDWIGDHTVGRRSGGRFRDTMELVGAAQNGNAAATECWLRSVRGLAVGIASLVNAFDPEVVVLGGGIAQCGEALFAPLRALMDEVEWRPTGERVPIVAARCGEFAGAIGAARFAAMQNESR